MSMSVREVRIESEVSEHKKRMEAHDDIQSILRHSGIFNPHLERLQQVSCQMRAMEWSMIRRDAATAMANRSGD